VNFRNYAALGDPYCKRVKCKIKGGGTVHSGLGPVRGRVPLPSTEIISGWERFDP